MSEIEMAYEREEREAAAWRLIRDEYMSATMRFGEFHNTHEGYAVILEELDELWEAIKSNRPIEIIRQEAVRIAAMALRFLVDCCQESET